jgi:hypothetical protein
LQCLERNVAKLSPPCKSAVGAVMPHRAPAAIAPPLPARATPPSPRPPALAPAPAAKMAPPPPPHHATARASQPSAARTNAIRASCRSDFMAHCPGVPPGGTAALHCLQASMARLSPACRRAVAATVPAPPRTRTGHAPPAAHPSAPARPAPSVAPLTLRPFILPQRRLIILAICHADAVRFCGFGRVLKCLAAKASSLSPRCYAAISRVSRR